MLLVSSKIVLGKTNELISDGSSIARYQVNLLLIVRINQ